MRSIHTPGNVVVVPSAWPEQLQPGHPSSLCMSLSPPSLPPLLPLPPPHIGEHIQTGGLEEPPRRRDGLKGCGFPQGEAGGQGLACLTGTLDSCIRYKRLF